MNDEMTGNGTAAIISSLNNTEQRCSNMNPQPQRVELSLHTYISKSDGIISPECAVQTAARMGQRAIAITDTYSLKALPAAMDEAERVTEAGAAIRVIPGMEIRIKEHDGEYGATLLARNHRGIRNLNILLTGALTEKNSEDALVISRDTIERHREGLLIGASGKDGRIFAALHHGVSDDELLRAAELYDYFEISFLENSMADKDTQKRIARDIFNLGKRLGKPAAAVGNVRFSSQTDNDTLINEIVAFSKGMPNGSSQSHMKTTEEMLELFAYLGEAEAYDAVVKNTNLIAELCDDVSMFPDEDTLRMQYMQGENDRLSTLVYQRAYALYGQRLPVIIQERIHKELNAAACTGSAALLLAVRFVAESSRAAGYPIGAHGSLCALLIAYLIGITQINPLPPHYVCPQCHHVEFITDGVYSCGIDMPEKNCPVCATAYNRFGYNMPMETVFGTDGKKSPYILLKVAGEFQNAAFDALREFFGEKRVCRCSIMAKLKYRHSDLTVKEWCSKHITSLNKRQYTDAVETVSKANYKITLHPDAAAIAPEKYDIYDFTALQPVNGAAGAISHYDRYTLGEKLPLVHILSHNVYSDLKKLHDATGIAPDTIPLDDEKTMSLFRDVKELGITLDEINCKQGTLGISRFESAFVRQILTAAPPASFDDLIRINGLLTGTGVWGDNAENLIKQRTAPLSKVISTYDDIMNDMVRCGCDRETAYLAADGVRRGRGLPKQAGVEILMHGMPEWYADSCNKIRYLFPRSDCVPDVLMSYCMAFYKAHFPEAFYSIHLSAIALLPEASELDTDMDAIASEIRVLCKNSDEPYAMSFAEEKRLNALCMLYEMKKRGIIKG